jgi:hypothetical protein
MIAFLAGAALMALIEASAGLMGPGLIPLIFAIAAIAAAAYRAGLRSSIFTRLGAAAAAVGISFVVSCTGIAIARAQPKQDLPFAEASAARDGYVRGSREACVEGEQANPANKGRSAASIDAFCSCFANTMADTVTKDELAYYKQHNASAPGMAEKFRAAYRHCSAAGDAAASPNKELAYAAGNPGRELFMANMLVSCTKGMQGNPGNKGVSAAAIATVCSCYASSMADTVTRDELTYLREHKAAAASMAEKDKTAAMRCVVMADAAAAPDKQHPYAGAGPARQTYVKAALASCAKRGQALAETKRFAAAATDAYCSCFANSMADVVTGDESVPMAQRQLPPGMAEKIDAVDQKCTRLAQGRQ